MWAWVLSLFLLVTVPLAKGNPCLEKECFCHPPDNEGDWVLLDPRNPYECEWWEAGSCTNIRGCYYECENEDGTPSEPFFWKCFPSEDLGEEPGDCGCREKIFSGCVLAEDNCGSPISEGKCSSDDGCVYMKPVEILEFGTCSSAKPVPKPDPPQPDPNPDPNPDPGPDPVPDPHNPSGTPYGFTTKDKIL